MPGSLRVMVVCAHPDDAEFHAGGLLVQDASFLLRVPNVEPDAPVIAEDPVILGFCDFFRRPSPFRADLVVDIEEQLDTVVDLLACHESQVYEWLPHIMGLEVEGERRSWLRAFYGRRPAAVADAHAGNGTRYAEAFELSEYGRQVTSDQLAELLTPGAAAAQRSG